MITVNEIDVANERQKSMANMVMLDALLQLLKQKEEQELAVANNKAEVKELSTKLDPMKVELNQLKVNLDKEEEDHKVKTAEWKQNNEKLQRILFKAEASSTTSQDNDQDLEKAVELAQKNAALLKQKLRIRQLSSAIRIKNPEVESMELALLEKMEMQHSLLNQLEKSEADLAVRKEEYRRKLQAEWDSNSIVVDLNAEIKHMKTDILCKDQMIKFQKSKITELELAIKSKDETIGLQQALIVPLRSEFELPDFSVDGDKSVEMQIKNAYQRGRNSVFKMMGPLANSGRFIRSRKLEWEKTTTPSPKLVELGNMASHYGMALADATLYQDFCPQKRNDPDVYVAMYGVHPESVWKNQECQLLLNILDWRCAMKDFFPRSYHRPSYESTNFHTLSRAFLNSVNLNLTKWNFSTLNSYLKDSEAGSTMYKTLRAEYEKGLANHNIKLKKR
jgi:hypothetical protein